MGDNHNHKRAMGRQSTGGLIVLLLSIISFLAGSLPSSDPWQPNIIWYGIGVIFLLGSAWLLLITE